MTRRGTAVDAAPTGWFAARDWKPAAFQREAWVRLAAIAYPPGAPAEARGTPD